MHYDYYNIIKEQYFKSKLGLMRFGSIGDGGYYLSPSSIIESDMLFSGGISSNVEFEFDFYRLNPNASLLMVDPTVSKWKLLLKGITRLFLNNKRKLSYLYNTLIFLDLTNKKRCKHLSKWLKTPEQIFSIIQTYFGDKKAVVLKLDIEGSEYDFLEELLAHQSQIRAMVFEFHDLDVKHHLLLDFIKKISNNFNLVYMEVNPSGGFVNSLPKCIELSFERK
ncbi:FkbM family methyltransferase [Mesoflavibacter zeaxanthinifaciens]|uniref:FkbM family methyltransferase n=1 Tax=Mesoflavibacter zeaxanthinifaciens TaxID=393060 RepID=UPI000424D859|nr:FkbM family methyltransferase [Mesoflavibacter zeaxanthinifaciens]